MEEKLRQFISDHMIQVENGGFFSPKTDKSFEWEGKKVLWWHYPCDSFPFWTFEVEEDIFIGKILPVNPELIIVAKGKELFTGKQVAGEMKIRPVISFEPVNMRYDKETDSYLRDWQWTQFGLVEVWNGGVRHVLKNDEFEIVNWFWRRKKK